MKQKRDVFLAWSPICFAMQGLPYLSWDPAQRGLLKTLWAGALSLLENLKSINSYLFLTNDSCSLTKCWISYWGEGLSLQVPTKMDWLGSGATEVQAKVWRFCCQARRSVCEGAVTLAPSIEERVRRSAELKGAPCAAIYSPDKRVLQCVDLGCSCRPGALCYLSARKGSIRPAGRPGPAWDPLTGEFKGKTSSSLESVLWWGFHQEAQQTTSWQ